MYKLIEEILTVTISENDKFIKINDCNREIMYVLCRSMEDDTVYENLRLILDNDIELFGHSVRTAILSILIGSNMGLNEQNIVNLSSGALLHDVGKLFISNTIINKKGKLSEQEYSEIKKHPLLGYELLEETDLNICSKKIVLEHHERADGLGYPNGSKEISPLSRIVSIADTYDAVTSKRAYKEKLNPAIALKIINDNIGTQFDSSVASMFCNDMSFI